ncbi:hypothetical protein O0L34_g9847 [Tuta absoluta]|nr:hypothetical protein O0L34_g9847 [Tuta absoluta]
MLYYLLLLPLLFGSSESLQKYTINNGELWSASVESCTNAGKQAKSTGFTLPSLPAIGLKYETIEELTTVIVRLKDTKLVSQHVVHPLYLLLLDTRSTSKGVKEFSGSHKLTATGGWATQENIVDVTVLFYETGTVKMILRVVAESRWSVSCADTYAQVRAIDIIV